MSDLIKIATASLLAPDDLNEHQLESVLSKAMGKSIDNADIYLQSTYSEQWYLEDGIVKEGSFHIDRGFGLRVISGEKIGFAYADQLNIKALDRAAQAAKSIVHSKDSGHIQIAKQSDVPQLYPDVNPLNTLSEDDKVGLLQRLDHYARHLDSRVMQVMVSLSGEHDVVMVM